MKFLKSELALIFALFITLTYTVFATNSYDNISEKVTRFHVLANSNSSYDQELKILIKNEIFYYISDITSNCSTNIETNELILQNISQINSLAQKIIIDNGFDYTVETALEYEYYPLKNYDDFSLPAGYYTGLNIKIGEALGENWWCVLFPPLCNQTAFDTKNLTPNELDYISSTDYEFRLKFVDFFESIKHQINS